jgi:signal transduction histidine kinase
MRSLFGKILLWFLATIVITIAAVIVTSLPNWNFERQPGFGMAIRLQMREVRYAYENGGKAALEESLKRFRSTYQAQMIVADSRGIDLVTGEDRSNLIRETERRRHRPPSFLFFLRPPPTFARVASDGKYWFFIVPPKQNNVLWFIQPQHIAIFVIVILLCYALAYYLTSPVRKLQQAVEKFGRGDLSARAPAGRRDELGKLARTFNQMADRIQTLVTAERRLLMDISHELRSPLARLGVAIELARSGHDHDVSLDRIQKEGDRLNALVGELLQVTRAEGDPAQRKHEPIQLDELLGEIVDDAQIEAAARKSEVRLESAGPCAIEGDPELMRRAVENVIRNAIRFSPEDEPIEVRLSCENGRALIGIRDHGPGVPGNSLPLLFEPFYRVESDRNRASGGVGLGLSIAKRAVALHGGSIIAKNAQPGLYVEIVLPLVDGRSPAKPGQSAQPVSAS